MDACPQGESKKKQIVLSSSSAGAGAMTITYCRGGGGLSMTLSCRLHSPLRMAVGPGRTLILKDLGREGRQVGILVTCSCSIRTDDQISAMLMLDFDLEGGFDPA